ncbi:MAG TPA: transcriptional regulator [Actinomycetes bacterium]|jgi:thiaminase|nr:transcriptional regulator [Actinomycetes bacterium]
MPEASAHPTAADLLADVQAELEPVERAVRGHPFLTALAEGRVARDRLADLAAEQQSIIGSDRRSFAFLAARFPAAPAGDLFLGLAQGEGTALEHLAGFARWLGLDPASLGDREPSARGQAYTAFVAWLALNGSATDVAVAFLANLAAWGENCGRVSAALAGQHDAGPEATAFFDFFATPAPGFREHALAVVQAGLAAGDPPAQARHAARLLQSYELMFWDSLMDPWPPAPAGAP